MKTPKFRAFVKKENRICEVKMLDFESKHITIISEDGCQFVNYDFADIEILQSTGFRDKNGKELFEGDIIQKPFYVDYDNYCQSKKYIGQVVYVDSSGCFSIKADNGIFYHLWELLEFSKDMDYIEVIGNIYENSKLLEVK